MTIKRLSWYIALLVGPLIGWAQTPQPVTERPAVDEVHDSDVSIRRIELTETYTILYMQFYHKRRRGESSMTLPFPYGQDQEMTPSSSIQFEPTARLFANRGDKSYKFIRAENIPTKNRMGVESGQRIDFVAYFERLDPGITVFDLFECNDRAGNICFNFFGVHVINPKRKPPVASKPAPVKPKKEPVKPTLPVKPAVPVTPSIAAKPGASTATALVSVAIQGTIQDAKTKKPVPATLAFQRLSSRKSQGEAPETVGSDAQTGAYQLTAKPTAVYAVSVKAKGYFSATDTLATNRSTLTHDWKLTPIETGAKLTLQNIYFDASKFELRPESYPELDRLTQLMRENPTLKIRLEGHTDIVGDFDANLDLSRNRVKEVKQYLVTKGITADRVDTIGYGSSRPITKKGNVSERQENRRVELVITQS